MLTYNSVLTINDDIIIVTNVCFLAVLFSEGTMMIINWEIIVFMQYPIDGIRFGF